MGAKNELQMDKGRYEYFLEKYKGKIKPEILKQYKDPDEYVLINEDKNLHPVWIKLPEPPEWHLIDGWGKPSKEQKFKHQIFPAKLQKLVDACTTVDEIWNELDERQTEFNSEISWMKTQIQTIFDGYWCFINGKPTFIDGWHYGYLNFWNFQGGISPEYRDRNRKFFHSLKYAYTTTESIKYSENRKVVYKDEERRIPEMVDMGRRTMAGIIYPKHRRDGASNQCLCAMYFETIYSLGKNSSIISASGKHAQETLFDEIMVSAWQQMPFFLRPITTSNENPGKSIDFFSSRSKANKAKKAYQLGSRILYSTTADASQLDGKKVFFLLADEGGKCFGKGTKIRMFDGSVKNVEDVENGDFVMGNDSTKRLVYGKTRGVENLYEIIPNKGKSFICNESHILHCVFIDRPFIWKGKKHKLGDVINLSVKEYISLNKWRQKVLGIYRQGWNYEEQEHILDPYFLGIWLGDGNSRDSSITSKDKEIIDFVYKYAERFGLFVRIKYDKISYRITSGIRKAGSNKISKELTRLNLFKNKHIPNSYLKDGRENRMLLLAGLLDTDGHLNKSKSRDGFHRSFEIIQKNDKISEGIIELATSLGFYVSKRTKVATMKREDGSLYESLVNRMSIYGDIDKIPTKVAHKKANVSRTKNRRNPLKNGFEITPKGRGDYFGFAVNENHLFLLEDGTVVHNTNEANVYERHQVLRETLGQGAGTVINGFVMMPSTVGEMEGQGGRNYKELCDDSKFEQRTDGGQTLTGMMLIYMPAHEGLEGYIDEYGGSVVEDYIAEDGTLKIGAKTYLNSTKDAYLRKNETEKYNHFCRLYPSQYSECFRTVDGDIGFNSKKINEQIEYLEEVKKEVLRQGNFKRERGEKDGRVYWEDDDVNGRFFVSKILNEDQTNRQYTRKIEGEVVRFPYESKFTASADPFKFDDTQGGRQSDGGGSVFWDYDQEMERGKDIKQWKSHRFVCTYLYRPAKKTDYAEDMLMMSVYYGARMYPEIDFPLIWDHFRDRGYGGYLKYGIDRSSGITKKTPGFNAKGSKQEVFNALRDYIEDHCERELHIDFLRQAKRIESMDEMTDNDLLAACAGCLLGTPGVLDNNTNEDKKQEKKIESILPKRRYNNYVN